jgi:casein kinase II subunit alpha
MPFESFVTPENKDLATPEAVAFLKQMLCYDFQERITAREALVHPFFASVPKVI